MNLHVLEGMWKQIITHTDLKKGCHWALVNSTLMHLSGNEVFISVDSSRFKPEFVSANNRQISEIITKDSGINIKASIFGWETKIPVTNAQLKMSVDFAVESLTSTTMRDFQQGNLTRTPEDYLVDTIEGKLSEYVFQTFLLKMSGLSFEVDINIYPKTTETDGGNDLLFITNNNGDQFLSNLKVDIKSTKSKHQWLLVEQVKAMADIYVLMKMDFVDESHLRKDTVNLRNIDNEEYKKSVKQDVISQLNNRTFYGEPAGFAYMSDIVDPETKKPWIKFKRGKDKVLLKVNELENVMTADPDKTHCLQEEFKDVITFLNTELKAEINYGMPASFLRSSKDEWKRFIKQIQASLIPRNDQLYLTKFPYLEKKSDAKKQYEDKKSSLLVRRNKKR